MRHIGSVVRAHPAVTPGARHSPTDRNVIVGRQWNQRTFGMTFMRNDSFSFTFAAERCGKPGPGIWESAERPVVIRRDQLSGIASYAGS